MKTKKLFKLESWLIVAMSSLMATSALAGNCTSQASVAPQPVALGGHFLRATEQAGSPQFDENGIRRMPVIRVRNPQVNFAPAKYALNEAVRLNPTFTPGRGLRSLHPRLRPGGR